MSSARLQTRVATSTLIALCVLCAAAAPSTHPATPKTESLALDLSKTQGTFTPRGSGFVRALNLTETPDDRIRPLRPHLFQQPVGSATNKYAAFTLVPRARSLNATIHVLLSDGFDTSKGFPGDKNDWKRWNDHVAGSIASARAAGAGSTHIRWEIWPQPNQSSSWKPSKERYYALWVRTHRMVRAAFPDAQIAGPSTTWDQKWIEEFLKMAKDYDALPDVITWSESSLRPNLRGHVDGLSNSLWQDGHGLRPIFIVNDLSSKYRHSPAAAVFFLAALERSSAAAGLRQGSGEHGTQFANLLTDKAHEPRPAWWVYKTYADLSGTSIKFSSTSAIDGLAVRDESVGTTRILLARATGSNKPMTQALTTAVNKAIPLEVKDAVKKVSSALPDSAVGKTITSILSPATRPITQPTTAPARVELKLQNLAGQRILIRAEELPYLAAAPLPAPVLRLESEAPINKGEARFTLPPFADHAAYVLTIRELP